MFDDKSCSETLRTLPCSVGGKRLWAQGSRNRLGGNGRGVGCQAQKSVKKESGGLFFAVFLEVEKAFGERFFSFGA